VIASYALPTLAGLATVGGWETWSSGQFASIGREVAGPFLGYWLFLGGAASMAVIFLSYVLWWSRLASAMAQDRHLPGFLRPLHPRYGTPHRILLSYALIYSAMAALPFEKILVADIWLTGASNMILQASLIRSRNQDTGGPGFRVPGGTIGVWLNAALPASTWLLVILLTAEEHGYVGATALLAGPLYWSVKGIRSGQFTT
jgi:amino acid transporter